MCTKHGELLLRDHKLVPETKHTVIEFSFLTFRSLEQSLLHSIVPFKIPWNLCTVLCCHYTDLQEVREGQTLKIRRLCSLCMLVCVSAAVLTSPPNATHRRTHPVSSTRRFKLSELQLHNVHLSSKTPQVHTKQRPRIIICGLFVATWKPARFMGHHSDDDQNHFKNYSFHYIFSEELSRAPK